MWIYDEYWLNALSACTQLHAAHRTIFTPAEFCLADRRFLPLAFSESVPVNEITAFCCPKDDIDLLQRRIFSQDFGRFSCIFVNEVFVLFSSHPDDLRLQVSADIRNRHLPYFHEKLALYSSGQAIRKSLLNSHYPIPDMSRPSRRPAILSVNAGGMRNFGDELIAGAVHKLLQAALPQADIFVGEPCLDRTIVNAATGIVVGGGGFLYDVEVRAHDHPRTNLQNIANYFRYAYLASQRHIPVLFAGIGHQARSGRLLNRDAMNYVGHAFQHAAAITTRDHATYRLIQALVPQFPQPDIHSLTDVVFSYFNRATFAAPSGGGSAPRTVALGGEIFEYGDDIMNCIVHWVREANLEITFVIQANEDESAAHQLAQRITNRPMAILDLRDMPTDQGLAAMRHFDAVVTTRYHSLIMALLYGLPFVALSRPGDKKHRLIMEELPELAGNLFVAGKQDGSHLGQCLRALDNGALPRPDISSLEHLHHKALTHIEIFKKAFAA